MKETLRKGRWRLLVWALLSVAALPAAAQSNQVRSLIDQVNMLQRDLNDLQREVYRGEAGGATSALRPGSPAPVPAVGNLLERQERLRHDVETRSASLTNGMERLGHRVDQLRGRVDKLVKDVDFRLGEIERSLAGIADGLAAQQAEAGAAGLPIPPPDGRRAAAGSTTESALAPGVKPLTLREQRFGILPEGTPEERYKFAYSLLRQLDFEQSERAFREFLDAHPDHSLAGNGQYWLGETYYVRGNFSQAAVAFLEGYGKTPTGHKAPDNLLKLGMSLVQLGQNGEACATFQQLIAKFPEASDRIKGIAAREQDRAGCS